MKQTAPSVSPMSNEARNSYVIGQITDALLGLLRSKPIEEVSISELCSAAGVGRASFYRNFASKEAVLQAGREPVNLMVSLLLFYKEHRDFYTLVYRNDSRILLDTILKVCGLAPEDANAVAYTKAFIAYGIYGAVSEWIGRGMTESAEELAALMAQSQQPQA